MPAGFRRHLVGKTLINVFHCYSAEIRFVGKLTSLNADIFINQRIECYLNNTTNLRPLTTHIMPCYTHKMTIISVTSFHPMYTPADCRQACTATQAVSRQWVGYAARGVAPLCSWRSRVCIQPATKVYKQNHKSLCCTAYSRKTAAK